MTKDDLKRFLVDKGASERLIQMPAVMERIYSYFDVLPESTYRGICGTLLNVNIILPRELSRMIKIGPNGSIRIENGPDQRIFEERPDNEAAYINNDQGIMGVDEQGEYIIDEYGMDKTFISKDGQIIQRNNAALMEANGRTYEDNGAPIINGAYYVELGITREKDEGEDKWEDNKAELTKNYPQTQEWFDIRDPQKRKRQTEKSIETSSNEETIDTNNVTTSDSDIEQIKEENEGLKGEKLALEAEREEDKKTIKYLQEKDEENGRTIAELRNSNDAKDATIVSLQQENAEKDERISDLQTRNSNLQERNTNLQTMLSKALDKLQQVKASIFGRFFFTKEERKEAKKVKRLPEGQEK